MANAIILPMAFLGGAFIPLNYAPAWINDVSYVMPLRYLVISMQDVIARGEGPASALPAIGILLGISAVLTAIAVPRLPLGRGRRGNRVRPGRPGAAGGAVIDDRYL